MPKLVQLGPRGQYVTPTAVGFLRLSFEKASLPVRIHLLLEGEYELLIPIETEAIQALREALQTAPAQPNP